MNLFTRMFKALKYDTTQVGSTGTPKDDIHQLGLTFQEANSHLTNAQKSRRALLAQQFFSTHNIDILNQQIQERKDRVLQAFYDNNEPLALEIAGEVVAIEQTKRTQTVLADQLNINIERLCSQVDQFSEHLSEVQRQLDQAKSTASIQVTKAVLVNAGEQSNKYILSIQERLAIIKSEQATVQARQELADVGAASLSNAFMNKADQQESEQKLAATSRLCTVNTAQAQDMLNRLKKQRHV